LVVDDACRDLVQTRGNASEIRQAALGAGMKLLAGDGISKVRQGLTTQSEVLRVTTIGEEE
jgi:type II secretory ATPase GspE/PulE/Tfp pilus assembly ATPase PilB-like protein